jgi:soluble lytic murein transglycosylase-like protein
MQRNTALMLLGAGALAWLLYSQRQTVTSAVESGEDMITAAVAGWKQVQLGPTWVPVINAAEAQYGIPPDLLARVAYQESHFRPDIISGNKVSSAGALGIMQLMPQYFDTVRVSRPFTDSDTSAQIQQAAGELARLYNYYGDWALSLAAYNDGQGNVDAYRAGTRPLPDKTYSYVSDILADVPVPGGAALA